MEVFSPTDRWSLILEKVSEYLEFGVREAWVIDPQEGSVHVFGIETAPWQFSKDGMLTSVVLPEFSGNVDKLFEGV